MTAPRPSLQDRLKQNPPPQDKNTRLREMLRRNPPTVLGSSSTLGGPDISGETEMNRYARPPAEGPGILETGSAIMGSIMPGMAFEARLASGMTSLMGRTAAAILGRGTGAAVGAVGASELTAPSNEEAVQASRRRAISALGAYAGEAPVPLLQAGITRHVMDPLRRRLGGLGSRELLELGTEEAQNLMLSMGQTLTPGMMRLGRLLDTFENVVGASFGGSQVMSIHRHRAEQAAIDSIEKSIPAFAQKLSTEDAGILLQTTLRRGVRLDRAATSAAYRDFSATLDQAGGIGEIVNVQSVFKKAKAKLGADPKDPGALEVMALLQRPLARRAQSYVPGTPDVPSPILGSSGQPSRMIPGQPEVPISEELPLTMEQAENLRSDLLSVARRGAGVLPSVKALAGQLAQDVNNSIEGASLSLTRFGPEVMGSLNRARAMSRITHERWDHDLVANLVERVKPEDLPGIILADNNPTQVRMVREVLFDRKYRIGQPDAAGNIVPPIKNPTGIWNDLKAHAILEQRTMAGEGKYSILSGKQLGQQLDSGSSTLHELLTPDEFRNLRVSARATELIQQAGKDKSGAIWMQLTQASAAGLLLGFGGRSGEAMAATILLAPIPAALALTNRGFAEWMKRMAQTSEARVGRLTASMAAQAIRALVQAKIPFGLQVGEGPMENFDPESMQNLSSETSKPQSKF